MRASFSLILSTMIMVSGIASAGVFSDDFNSYTDGDELTGNFGLPTNDWVGGEQGPVEKSTVTIVGADAGTYEVVQDPTQGSTYNTSFNQIGAFDTNSHNMASVQADLIYTNTGNAQVAGVVLHNAGTTVGMYGNVGHYRFNVDTKYGGRLALAWPSGGIGNITTGIRGTNEWHRLELEADHAVAGVVTLTAVLRDPDTSMELHTITTNMFGSDILTGGNAGIQIEDNVPGFSPHIFMDNYCQEYTFETTTTSSTSTTGPVCDDFDSYTDGDLLENNFGLPNADWIAGEQGPVEKSTVTIVGADAGTYEVVIDPTLGSSYNTSFNQISTFNIGSHNFASVQADVIYTNTGNAQVGGVVLHNASTTIGMYGNVGHYRFNLDTKYGGRFSLGWPGGGIGNILTGVRGTNEWHRLELEADHRFAGLVTLTAVVRDPDTSMALNTITTNMFGSEILTGGNAGIQIEDVVPGISPHIFMDNYCQEYTFETTTTSSTSTTGPVCDDFDSYTDGDLLENNFGLPNADWIAGEQGPVEKTTVNIVGADAGTYEVVKDATTFNVSYNTSFNTMSGYDSGSHNFACVQADVIYTNTGNAQVGGVVLHNPSTTIGMYGGENHYRFFLDTKYGGRFSLNWPGGGIGNIFTGVRGTNEWHRLELEADHRFAGQVTLTAVVRDPDTSMALNTITTNMFGSEILTGANAGVQIEDVTAASPHIFVDNYCHEYSFVTTTSTTSTFSSTTTTSSTSTTSTSTTSSTSTDSTTTSSTTSTTFSTTSSTTSTTTTSTSSTTGPFLDDFNTYTDGDKLENNLGLPDNDWIAGDQGPLEKATLPIAGLGTFEVVLDPTFGTTYNTSFNQVFAFSTNDHVYARVQADVIWTNTGNAQVGAVVLHNAGTTIGMYGGDNHYRMLIDSKYGGQWGLSWPGGSSGPRFGVTQNTWYRMILEANHETPGQVALTATIQNPGNGFPIDSFEHVATGGQILTGQNAGIQIEDNVGGISPHIFLDNFDLVYSNAAPIQPPPRTSAMDDFNSYDDGDDLVNSLGFPSNQWVATDHGPVEKNTLVIGAGPDAGTYEIVQDSADSGNYRTSLNKVAEHRGETNVRVQVDVLLTAGFNANISGVVLHNPDTLVGQYGHLNHYRMTVESLDKFYSITLPDGSGTGRLGINPPMQLNEWYTLILDADHSVSGQVTLTGTVLDRSSGTTNGMFTTNVTGAAAISGGFSGVQLHDQAGDTIPGDRHIYLDNFKVQYGMEPEPPETGMLLIIR